jgi:hypothetical protein
MPTKAPKTAGPLPEIETPAADPKDPTDNRVARILTTGNSVKAKGFTFGKGQTVEGVSLAHAEYLLSKGEAQILEVS